MLPFSQVWLPFIYLYVVGGLFFGIAMFLIRKSNSVNMNLKRHRYWYKVLYFGFFYFAIMHLVLILTALYL
jgi:hypothetical protein